MAGKKVACGGGGVTWVALNVFKVLGMFTPMLCSVCTFLGNKEIEEEFTNEMGPRGAYLSLG